MDSYHEYQGDTFCWDADKARSNFAKHGIRFEEAATVFSDPLFVMTDASRHDEGRDAVIGLDASARLLFVVHIEIVGQAIRIISARRATRQEESLYAD